MSLFEGHSWSELEAAAALFDEAEVARGSRLTVQGRPDPYLWLISTGEALVSADARPLRVIGPGEAAGIPGMLYSISSPETTIALNPIKALVAGPREFNELISDDRIRRRLTGLAGDALRSRRASRPR